MEAPSGPDEGGEGFCPTNTSAVMQLSGQGECQLFPQISSTWTNADCTLQATSARFDSEWFISTTSEPPLLHPRSHLPFSAITKGNGRADPEGLDAASRRPTEPQRAAHPIPGFSRAGHQKASRSLPMAVPALHSPEPSTFRNPPRSSHEPGRRPFRDYPCS
jgi:hypothetical protein